jgi:hypothetical protein
LTNTKNRDIPFFSSKVLASFQRMLLVAPFGNMTSMDNRTGAHRESIKEFLDNALVEHENPTMRAALTESWKKHLRSKNPSPALSVASTLVGSGYIGSRFKIRMEGEGESAGNLEDANGGGPVE